VEDELTYLSKLGYEERKHFESVGDSNHVVVRALQAAQLKTNDDASLATGLQKSSLGRSGASATLLLSCAASARNWRTPARCACR
jgi:hypothetical protein